MPDIVIELNTDSLLSEYGFYCSEIIDKRDSKNNIGYVSRGIGNNNTKIIFQEDSTKYLIKTLKNLLPKEETKPEIVLILKSIIASENIGTQNQYGFCNAEIEFAKQVDTSLYSLGTFYSSISEKSNRIKYTHGKRVLAALEDCLIQFNNSGWKDKDGKLSNSIIKDSIFDYKSPPNKGAYFDYNKLKNKKPFDTQEYDYIIANNSKKFTTYKIDFKGFINPKLVQFVSDGENIYMRINEFLFLKSESYGKYIFFRGRVPTNPENHELNYSDRKKISSSISNELIGTQIAAGLIIGLTAGLTGGVFFYSGGDTPQTNTSIKGVVIDTETDELKFVTDMYLYRITKKFPALLKEYRKSKRKTEDKRSVIESLNSKF
jgi:hypothetical protein